MTEAEVKFDLKCVVCGRKETRDGAKIDPHEGPSCPKCLGPMIVEEVEVRR